MNITKNLLLKYLSNTFILNYLYSLYFCKKNKKYIKKISTLNEIYKFKKSDTLIIIVPGYSLNELNNEQVKHLEKFDTMGMSYTVHFNIKHTFYLFESAKDINLSKNVKKIKENLNKEYLKCVIWKNPEDVNSLDCINDLLDYRNVYTFLTVNMLGINKKFIDFFVRKNLFNCLFQIRGTVVCATMLGIKLGYKKIIYCGVDLNNSEYFFENERFKNTGLVNLYKSIYNMQYNKELHPTANPLFGIPIDKILFFFKEEYKDIIFLTTSKNSKLYEFLDLYEIKRNNV